MLLNLEEKGNCELQILVIKGMQYFITLWTARFIVHMS